MDSGINPVSFTPAAFTELQHLMANLKIDSRQCLRIGIKDGGCAGSEYLLAFDLKNENDREYEIDGLNIIVSKSHVMHILGMQIGWENDQNNKGFVFLNPER